jgi:nitric oxide reductase large subunit
MKTDYTNMWPFEVPPDLGQLENQNQKLSNENKWLKRILVLIGIAGIICFIYNEYQKNNRSREHR